MRPRSLLLLLVLAGAAPLAAQEIRPLDRPIREGFWWGLGLGVANAKVSCDSCPSVDPELFPMFDVRLGGTVSPHVTVGAQVAGGRKSGAFGDPGSVDHTVGDVNVSAYIYPRAAGDLWIQAGLAAVVWQGDDGSTRLHSTAAGLTLGIGYDIPLGARSSIAPSLRGVFGGKGKVTDGDGNSANLHFETWFVELGAAVVWH